MLNVGGAVGYAGAVEIKQIYSNANVYGNTSVGGLVGYAKGATLTDNYITPKPESPENSENAIVKGIYYNYNYKQNIGGSETASYIPTSVGGLVGSSQNSNLTYNILNGVQVTSTDEGTNDGDVISTISNYMVDFAVGDENAAITSSTEAYVLDASDDYKTEFNDITTGFGGFIGSTNTEFDSTNVMNSITISAQLGVNVGTYYGVLAGRSDTVSTNISVPTLHGSVKVDGAYNIGGLIGFVDGNASYITNNGLPGDGTINLQSNFTGMYVGGLIGKVNTNNDINNLLITANGSPNIEINTNNSYYIGGLIGRAEVNGNINISGNVEESWNITTDDSKKITSMSHNSEGCITNSDNPATFGGLLGMLKVAGGGAYNVKVEGKHNYAFTINTIENSNYADGTSRYNNKYDENGIALEAEAFYINKDIFTIEGSSNVTLYDNNNDTNPLNPCAQGWVKDYTGFKQLQRCIPMSQNNGAEWDSIAVLFDAASISHVGTIANLGLTDTLLYGNLRDWTESYNKARVYDLVEENGTEIKLPENPTEEQIAVYNSLVMIKKEDETYKFNPNYICYTVYEQAPGLYTLYSPIGFGQVALEYREDPKYKDNYYFEVENEEASVGSTILGFFLEQEPPETYYISTNNNTELQGLTYFKYGDGTNWKSYKTVDTDTSKTYINEGGSENGEVKNDHKVAVFVPNFLKGDANYAGDVQHNGSGPNGAYFVFDTMFDNASLNGLKGKTDESEKTISDVTNTNLPKSGSMFEMSGIHTKENEEIKQNAGDKSDFETAAKVTSVVVDLVITAVTFGVGGAISAGVKQVAHRGAQSAFKAFAKAAGKRISRKIGEKGFKKVLKKGGKKVLTRILITHLTMAVLTLAQDQNNAYYNFAQPSYMDYGYLGAQYAKSIRYTTKDGNVVLEQESDYNYTNDNGDTFYYFSNTRPSDYHTSKYIGIKISDGSTYKTGSDNTHNDYPIFGMIDFLTDDDGKNTVYTPISITDLVEGPKNVYIVDYNGTTFSKVETDQPVEQVAKHKDGSYYIISPKYEMVNGQYYINANAGEILTYRTSLEFTPEKDIAGNDLKEPNFVTKDGSVYVHGNFNGKEYKYANYDGSSWDYEPKYKYTSNNLMYDGSSYVINGETYSADIIETSDQPMYYSINTNELQNSIDSKNTKGYYWFDKAYYTVNGNHNMKYGVTEANPEGIKLVRYATFKYFGENTIPSEKMTEDVDYIKIPYSYSKTVGEGDNAETTNHSGYYCYTIESIATKGSVSGRTQMDATHDDNVVRAIYPKTFINPYKNANGTEKEIDNSHDNDNIMNNLYTYYHTEEKSSDSIEFSPKYFLYEGGYVVDSDTVNYSFPMVYIKMDESLYKNGENFATISVKEISNYDEVVNDTTDTKEFKFDGSTKTIGFNELINHLKGEDTDKTDPDEKYYATVYEQPIYEMFKVDDKGILYKYNSNYTLGKDDKLLHKIYVKRDTAVKNIYENMYLHYPSVKLYTRYKYTNFLSSPWKEYELIPKAGSTTINYGKPTRLVESVKVILGGNGKEIQAVNSSDGTKIEAGGVSVI